MERESMEFDVVVIGGGVIGCSIAYHLCRAGVSDVLVLERNEVASGATPEGLCDVTPATLSRFPARRSRP